jgi:hypothetical protein
MFLWPPGLFYGSTPDDNDIESRLFLRSFKGQFQEMFKPFFARIDRRRTAAGLLLFGVYFSLILKEAFLMWVIGKSLKSIHT